MSAERSKPSPEANIRALVKLLADDPPEVVEVARTKLVEVGAPAIPLLEEAARSHDDPKVRVEAQGVLERLRLDRVRKDWEKATDVPDEKMDLEQGALLLAKVCYPEMDAKRCREQLDKLAEKVRPKVAGLEKPK